MPGLEEVAGSTYRRALRLTHGVGVVALDLGGADAIITTLRLDDPRDEDEAIAVSRRMLDLDANPLAIDAHLAADPLLAPLVRAAPGGRSPGSADGAELALRAVLGQQVSVAAARTAAARLVAQLGDPLAAPEGGVTHAFPRPEVLADHPLPGPASRARAFRDLAAALAGGFELHPGVDREAARERLLAIRGIGPWTADYIAMRALGHPDAFLPTDLGVRHAVGRLGRAADPATLRRLAEPWRPYRAYAVHRLWASLGA